MPAVVDSWYTEHAVSSLTIAVTITSTRFAYPCRDGQAELARMAWSNMKMLYVRTVTHLGTNPAQRRVTSLMRPTMLLLGEKMQRRSEWYNVVMLNT